MQMRQITAIEIGHRHRKNLGDLDSLAESLEKVGLLHPVVIDSKNRLIAGQRRLEAAKLLGWQTIPVRVVDLEAITLGEFAENACRKDFTPSEIAAIAKVVRPLEEEKAHQRRLAGLRNQALVGENCHDGLIGKTRDIVARFTGISGRTLDKIEAIVGAAEDEPARFGHLKDELDAEPRSVHRCYKKLKALQQQAEEQRARASLDRPAWVLTDVQSVVECSLVIADPPDGMSQEEWEPRDLETFTRAWSRRWSKCGADFIAIFWSQDRLFQGRQWLDEALEGYTFQQVLVWHANNNGCPKNPLGFKQTWEPILLYRRKGSIKPIVPSERTLNAELHTLDCHAAPVPQINDSGHDLKQHPTQKPVSVMHWLIHALTEPGERVASPFCGVAPCGIAALQLGRNYHGIEISADYRRLAEARLASYGRIPSKWRTTSLDCDPSNALDCTLYKNLPEQKYNTLVIDPPWQIATMGTRTVVASRRNHNQGPVPYEMLTLEEIKQFPLRNLANDGAHVYLWTTNSMLPVAFEVLEAWGVHYHLTMPLVKKSGVAPCNGYVAGAEFCLLGFAGRPMQSFRSVGKLNWLLTSPRPHSHSRKPDEFYDLVEEMSPGPYIDLFGRQRRPNWDSWGDEVKPVEATEGKSATDQTGINLDEVTQQAQTYR